MSPLRLSRVPAIQHRPQTPLGELVVTLAIQMKIYLSHAAQTPVSVIRGLIADRGVIVHDSFDLSAGQNLSTSVADQIVNADAVVAVIEEGSPNLFYELGLAVASGKPILTILKPETILPPFLAGLPYLTSDLKNSKALRFSLDQFMEGIGKKKSTTREHKSPATGLGRQRELQTMAQRFATLRTGGSLREVEALFRSFLETAGVSAIQERSGKDDGADLAIWSDGLRTTVGSPILIELKVARLNGFSFRVAYSNLVAAVQSSSAAAGLLLYLDREMSRFDKPNNWTPAVLWSDLEDFASRVAASGFENTVLQLRNEYVHGLVG